MGSTRLELEQDSQTLWKLTEGGKWRERVTNLGMKISPTKIRRFLLRSFNPANCKERRSWFFPFKALILKQGLSILNALEEHVCTGLVASIMSVSFERNQTIADWAKVLSDCQTRRKQSAIWNLPRGCHCLKPLMYKKDRRSLGFTFLTPLRTS